MDVTASTHGSHHHLADSAGIPAICPRIGRAGLLMASIIHSHRGGRRRLMADINVTPMVDVMLVLLVVFMITAPMLTTGFAVNLPRTRAAPLETTQEQPLIVTVDREGGIFVAGERTPADPARLPDQLRAIAEAMADKRAYVSGDGEVEYEQVVSMLSLLQAAGFDKVGLVVDARPAASDAR
jgi:biopolymer transport protein TolR